ncbi:hypothetical protein [Paenibacillus tengchongensis]|uniref:hypothetical protein n=1 Tax=Paenibacillus tengchongensis TaxID=2608684 RepID=UPI00124D6697|nr:hypothetical protein [Paenibacillus tengchongensis]
MPRIERIRIAGLKYEKMLKKYDDMILDLCNEEGPANTLITLMNGGGKGVLLQSIFQLLIPKTPWGKDNENQVEAFFHNHKKQLRPYTFHVAIEWRLDHSEHAEYMTTGIAMTAQSSADLLEIKVDYLLYTLMDYDEHAELTLSTLPLYNHEAGAPVAFETLQQFVRERRNEMVYYGSSSAELNKYYSYLAERDIHIGEWRNMKKINGEEGGIKGFFKKHDAFTNHNLFERLILPEIGASLSEGLSKDEGSLQKMFVDAATVAQRLPMLEQREKAFAGFTDLAVPLHGLVRQGVEAETDFRDTQRLGRQIYTVLLDELAAAEAGQAAKLGEMAELAQEGRQLRFESDNLKFLRSKEEYDAKQLEFDRVTGDQLRAKQRLEDSRTKEKSLEAAFHLAKRRGVLRHISQWRKEIEAIEGSLEMQERQQVIRAAREELDGQWPAISRAWQNKQRRFRDSLGALQAEEAAVRKEREQLLLETGGLEGKIGELTAAIRQYSEEAGAFAAKYGHEAAAAPASALQRSLLAVRSNVERLVEWSGKRAAADERRLALHKAEAEGTAKLSARTQQMEELGARLEAQLARESQLWSQLVVHLELYGEHQRYGATGLFEAKQAAAEALIRRSEDALQQVKKLRREYYHQLMDVELQQEAYWLPNADLLTVKERLEQLKISAMLGSAYLNDLPYSAREEELERQPLLPYGLILTRREADKLQPDILAEFILKAPVPVFVREEMSASAGNAFLLPADEGRQLALQPERFREWKRGSAARLREQEEELREAEAYLAKLKAVQQEAERLYQSEHSQQLQNKLRILELGHRELLADQERLNAGISSNEEEWKAAQQQLTEAEAEKAELAGRIQALREWERRAVRQERDYKDKQAAVERKNRLAKDISVMDQRLAVLKMEMEGIHKQREQWMGDTRYSLFPRLQSWLPEIIFPAEQEAVAEEDMDQELLAAGALSVADSRLLELLSTLESLQQSLTQNELEIRLREGNIKRAGEQQAELETELAQLNPVWRSLPEPQDSPEAIMAARNRQKHESGALEEDYLMLRESYVRCHTELENLGKDKNKAEKAIKEKHERAPELWPGPLDGKEEDILSRSRDNEFRLNEAKKSLVGFERLLQSLTSQSKMMELHAEGRAALREVPEDVQEQVRGNSDSAVAGWLQRSKASQQARSEITRRVQDEKNSLLEKIAASGWNRELESKLVDRLGSVHWEDFPVALQVLEAMLQSSHDQIESIRNDKEGMELSRMMWTGRAAKRVVQILDILKRMERRMIIHNENGHAFPLVRLNYKQMTVPRTTEDIEPLVSDYFNRCIHMLLEKYPKIEQVPAGAIRELVNDGKIVYTALQNRFPVLQVYKPVTENYFLYAAPEDYHYSDWEVINRGALDEAVGSGGQRQSVQLLVAMMIMTHKRVNRENKGWTVFLYDNPFGEMVSNNVLDPVFEISRALRFQWLIVTPPELVKNDVSVRFGVYWQLYFGGEKGEMLESTLVKGGRKLIPATLF